MEIVSEPDMSTPQEAAAYLRKLSGLLRYIGTCTGSMEEVRHLLAAFSGCPDGRLGVTAL
jgi:hypothetical protein